MRGCPTGRPARKYQPFVTTLQALKAGSFRVVLRFGQKDMSQLAFSLDAEVVEASTVIDDVLQGVELLNSGDYEGLKRLIPDQAYRDQFVSMARKLAPDGDRVSGFALSSNRRQVGLTRKQDDITLEITIRQPEMEVLKEAITVEGILDVASSRGTPKIELTPEGEKPYTVFVREGLDDLVRSHFGDLVVVTGLTRGKRDIDLIDIRKAEE